MDIICLKALKSDVSFIFTEIEKESCGDRSSGLLVKSSCPREGFLPSLWQSTTNRMSGWIFLAVNSDLLTCVMWSSPAPSLLRWKAHVVENILSTPAWTGRQDSPQGRCPTHPESSPGHRWVPATWCRLGFGLTGCSMPGVVWSTVALSWAYLIGCTNIFGPCWPINEISSTTPVYVWGKSWS